MSALAEIFAACMQLALYPVNISAHPQPQRSDAQCLMWRVTLGLSFSGRIGYIHPEAYSLTGTCYVEPNHTKNTLMQVLLMLKHKSSSSSCPAEDVAA